MTDNDKPNAIEARIDDYRALERKEVERIKSEYPTETHEQMVARLLKWQAENDFIAFVKPNPFDEFPPAKPTRIAYIVWNNTRTEGYVTFDKGVAYEARKGAESNCFDADGTQMKLAQAFCEVYSAREDATIQTVVIGEP